MCYDRSYGAQDFLVSKYFHGINVVIVDDGCSIVIVDLLIFYVGILMIIMAIALKCMESLLLQD